mmetsp:Transcript_10320/g.11779  ORF Transcript_10320/g.11779 Transcript_10320/m.11779 type:complete len:178 (+) Transcript_10320:75-608(+)
MTSDNNTMLYVGNLPWDAKDADLTTLFSSYECSSAEMQRYRDSDRSKGFALVSVADGTKAIADLHDKEFQGRKIIVREDRGPLDKPGARKKKERNEEEAPCDTVYVGNLPWEFSTEMLAEKFPGHTSADVKIGNDGRSRGYGLVKFSGVDEAKQAIEKMNGEEISGRAMVCRFSRPT